MPQLDYMSDRQRVELMLLPMIAQSVVKFGADNPNDPTAIAAVDHFAAAIHEVVANLPTKKRYSLLRRASFLHNSVIRPHREAGGRVDKVGLMLYYILQWSIQSGYLVLHDGTPMAMGLDLLLPALTFSANVAKLDASAHKAATKLLATLQEERFFQGVQILEDA